MDAIGIASLVIAGCGYTAAALFLLGMLFVDVTETGWRIRAPGR